MTPFGSPEGLPLLSGERVLWSGQPYTGLILRPLDALLIPFSLIWAGFAFTAIFGFYSGGTPLPFDLFGLIFVFAGLYATVGRFIHDIWLRSRLRYAVTNRRVLILSGQRLRSLDLASMPLMDMEERNDGSGTLHFGERGNVFGRNGFGLWTPSLDATPQLIRIPNVRAVYELISKQAAEARRTQH
jgi:hypothetical protein